MRTLIGPFGAGLLVAVLAAGCSKPAPIDPQAVNPAATAGGMGKGKKPSDRVTAPPR
jgi:hypothetical protein